MEHTFFRYTSMIGEGLRARSPAGQGSEVVLGCEILNRMTALGRPVSYRLDRGGSCRWASCEPVTIRATTPREGFGVGAHTAAELLIIFGDNPDRIRSEAAFAKLCGACPIPASSGMTTGRHRLNRGGHRQANAALYRAVIVRMRFHQPTRDYVARRTANGRTKREIIRCLKRFLAREIYQRVMTDYCARQEIIQAA